MLLIVLSLIVLFYVLFVCKCVLYYCHQVSIQLQLTNISSYHIISYRISYHIRFRATLSAGAHKFFQKSRGHIIILGARRVMQQVSSTNIRGHFKKISHLREMAPWIYALPNCHTQSWRYIRSQIWSNKPKRRMAKSRLTLQPVC